MTGCSIVTLPVNDCDFDVCEKIMNFANFTATYRSIVYNGQTISHVGPVRSIEDAMQPRHYRKELLYEKAHYNLHR